MELIKLGSIYFDGQVQDSIFSCRDSTNIAFGDTVLGKEIEKENVMGIKETRNIGEG